MRDPIRLRRTVAFLGVDLEVEAVLPPDACPSDVALAALDLDRTASVLRDSCPGCGVPHAFVHSPECVYATADLIENMRAVAIEEGMAP